MADMPQTKADLLAELEQAWQALNETLDAWTEEQMTERRDAVGWSVKDHLDHLIPWEEGVVALLEHRPRFAVMGLDETAVETKGYDEVNALLRAQTPRRGLTETRAALRAAHASMQRVLNRLSDDDLFKPYSHYQPEARGENSGNPVINWIVGNSSEHYREHLGYMQDIVGPESSAQAKWRLART